MAGEGYPRHDLRKYVDILMRGRLFAIKLKNKNMLPASTNKTTFVNELVRQIQELIDREDKRGISKREIFEHVLEHKSDSYFSGIIWGTSID